MSNKLYIKKLNVLGSWINKRWKKPYIQCWADYHLITCQVLHMFLFVQKSTMFEYMDRSNLKLNIYAQIK
jgi:hypothetical protein